MDEYSVFNSPITFQEIIDFLDFTQRSNKCPTCGQEERDWRFHLDPDSPDIGDSDDMRKRWMAVFHMPIVGIQTHQITEKYLPVVAIECDQCSHMEFLNVFAIERYRRAKAGGSQE